MRLWALEDGETLSVLVATLFESGVVAVACGGGGDALVCVVWPSLVCCVIRIGGDRNAQSCRPPAVVTRGVQVHMAEGKLWAWPDGVNAGTGTAARAN